MSTRRNKSLEAYHAQLSLAAPVDIMIWKTLKGIVQFLLLFGTAHVGVLFGADPTVLYPIGLVGGIVMMVGEVKEVEVAGIATIILGGNNNNKK